jgi:fucose 4-O-acetylase-like acetyltransferase
MERNIYIDNIKGYLILLVIIYHIVGRMRGNFDIAIQIHMFISFFHMPMFILISGYLSKSKVGLLPIKKNFCNIFLPYLIFQLLLVCIYFFYNPLTVKNVIKILLTPQYALWYLYCMFFWRLILPFYLKLPYPLLLSVIIGLLGGFLPSYATPIFSISRITAFFPFFILGYMLKKYDIFERSYFRNDNNNYLIRIMCIILVILALCSAVILNGRFLEYFLHYQFYSLIERPIWFSVIMRFVAYVISILVGFSFIMLIKKTKSFLTKTGKRSLYPYILHTVIFYIILQEKWLEEIIELKYFFIVTLLGLPLTMFLSSDIVKKATKIFIEPVRIGNKSV